MLVSFCNHIVRNMRATTIALVVVALVGAVCAQQPPRPQPSLFFESKVVVESWDKQSNTTHVGEGNTSFYKLRILRSKQSLFSANVRADDPCECQSAPSSLSACLVLMFLCVRAL